MQRTIDVHISDLLYHQECVVVPSFGAFLTRHFSAELNPSTHMMRPAGKRVSFNSRIDQNDGLLANYISREEGITYNEAIESITISVRGWKRMLRSGKKINLPLVGKLYLNNEGQIQFSPSLEINYDVNAFGLGIFRAPSIPREIAIEQSINKVIEQQKEKIGRPVQYKPILRWAAVAGTLVALGIYASTAFGDLTPNGFASLLPNWSESKTEHAIQPAKVVEAYELDEIEVEGALHFEVETNEEVAVTPKKTDSFKENATVVDMPYHIIIGSFKEYANAKRYMQTVSANGIEPYIAKGKSNFYRVSAGGFNTRNQADKAMANIKAQINSAAWVYRN
jgi:nucleoid DNA-binding protein